jgi:hypothetical protein
VKVKEADQDKIIKSLSNLILENSYNGAISKGISHFEFHSMLITVSTHNVREQKTVQIVWAIVKSAKEELTEALLDKQFSTYI